MRLLWADIMKLLAVFGVILLHVSAPFLVPFEETREWWIGNIYDSISRWCVPLFVMMSGALLLPSADKLPLRRFFLVRIRRIAVPFLVWSGLFFVYRMQVKGDPLAPLDFFRMLLVEPIYYHLWFVYMLLVLYLLAPIVSAFLNHAGEKLAWYAVALWFFWASFLPIVDTPFDFETYFTPNMDDYSPLRLSGYFLLGYMLRDRQARSRGEWFVSVFLFLIGAATTAFGTYALSREEGVFRPYFYKYFSVSVVAMTLSLFIIVKSAATSRKGGAGERAARDQARSPKLVQRLGESVFGIYLLHALVLELLRDGRLGFTVNHTNALGVDVGPVAGIPLFSLAILLFSLVPIFLVRFAPGVREVVT